MIYATTFPYLKRFEIHAQLNPKFSFTAIFFRFWHWKTGVFYYFFLDYTRNPFAVVGYALLIVAVSSFFFLGDLLSVWLKPPVDF